jgi:transcriptional regulator with GAF, ATPase, and Fis domain
VRDEPRSNEIVGASEALWQDLSNAKAVATSEATVLILGATGTGKELIARAIHRMSPRSEKNFLAIQLRCHPSRSAGERVVRL